MAKAMQKGKPERSQKEKKKTNSGKTVLRITSDFSPETTQARRQCFNIDKVLKRKAVTHEFYI